MGEIRTYKDLDVWIQSKTLAVTIYDVTTGFPMEERFGLTNQLRRAAVSVPSNIAEGCGRGTYKGVVNFLFNARGSLYEIETQILVARELDYLVDEQLKSILIQIEECKKLLNGFIRYFESKATNN